MSNNKFSNILKKYKYDFSWDWDLVNGRPSFRKYLKKATSRYNRRVNKKLVIKDQYITD